MLATRFASANYHSVQHKVVLQVMREGAAQAAAGALAAVRVMAGELALWLPQHAQRMDAALALHLRRAGYDPVTGIVGRPAELPTRLVETCASAACPDTIPA